MFRTAISTALPRSAVATVRPLHSTPVTFKTVTEKVSEVADTVNKKLGKGLASAIETGEAATQATKSTLGSAATKTKETAQEGANVAHQKGNEAKVKVKEMKK